MKTTEPRPIGETLFIDGTTRTVFEDADGGQFVVDPVGEHVHGVWVYIDEPNIIRSKANGSAKSLALRNE